jgi:REP element-mobilizing transposase RayT
MARAEVSAPDEVAVVHVMNRVVRRCYLLGDDPVSGKNYDHRKVMIENQLQRLAGAFGIDLLGFAIMSNHFHLILRSRPDVVLTWDDTEVARRWLLICPVRKNSAGDPEEPNEFELNSIRNDPGKLETIRLRLSDLGWWMRVLCQYIAVRANREDNELGKFWQSRFRAVRLLDEATLLACAAYVDLNPIRAAMAETLEHSHYTSVQRRIQSFSPANDNSTSATSATSQPKKEISDNPVGVVISAAIGNEEASARVSPIAMQSRVTADRFLSPIALIPADDQRLGPQASSNRFRCSDKGFLPLSQGDYLELLDWTARQVAPGKRGTTPPSAPPLFQRLSGKLPTATAWVELVQDFGKLFAVVAGHPQTIRATRSRISGFPHRMRPRVRELLSSSE